MPFTRKKRVWGRRPAKKYGYRKRTYRASRYGRKARPAGLAFPRNFRTKLIYNDATNTLTATSGVYTSYSYSVNDCYDPNVTGAGGQPRYFDTLCGADAGSAPYSAFRVYGCKVIATFTNGSPTACICGLDFRPSSKAGSTNIIDVAELSDGKTKNMTGNTSGPGKCVISKYISINKLYNVPKVAVKVNGNFAGAYNASPASRGVVDLCIQPNTATTTSVTINVKLIYYVEFFSLNNVTYS